MTTIDATVALENIESVLCDPEGKCCIRGSNSDRAIVDEALDALRAALTEAQTVQPALTDIDALAKLYCGSYASPHHITFTVEGLRNMIQAAIVAAIASKGAQE